MKLYILGSGPTRIVERGGKNTRRNSSAILRYDNINILIDVPRQFKEQMRLFGKGIKKIDYIIFTHGHNDCTGGWYQLRDWLRKHQNFRPVCFAERQTWKRLREDFKDTGFVDFKFFRAGEMIKLPKGMKIKTWRVPHSIQPGYPTCGFRFEYKGKAIVYNEDVGEDLLKEKYKKVWKYYDNADAVIFDAAMYFDRQIKGHFNVENALKFLRQFNIKHIFLTQAGHTYPKYSQAVKEIKQYWDAIKRGSKAKVHLTYDGMIIDTAKPMNLFTIIGSKQRMKETIVEQFPNWVKTVFDPMAGSGAVLHELKKHGVKVIANDIAPMCYFWLKAILGNRKISSALENKILNATPVEGWLTNASCLRPKRKAARMYIDGMVKAAWKLPSPDKELVLGAISNMITKFQGSLGIFRKQFEPYPKKLIQKMFKKSVEEINSLIVDGKEPKITMNDVFNMEFPNADGVFFDPPYDQKGAAEVPYGPHYRIINSILMQKDWNIPDFPRNSIPDLVTRLANCSKVIVITTADDPKVNYKKLLKDAKKFIKLIKFKRKTGGAAPKAEKEQTDLIWIASSYQRIDGSMIEMREAIYLPEPHARLVWEGKKKWIIRAKNYSSMVGKLLYVVDKNNCYGIIKLKKPLAITLAQFKKYQNQHLVTDEERKKWWPHKRILFAYGYDVIQMFKTPRPVKIPQGVQTFVKDFKFLAEFEDFNIYEEEVLTYENLLTLEERSDELSRNVELSLIQDTVHYNPRVANNKQLADDWRIVAAWYSTKKRGGRIKHSLETIVNLAKLIYDEIVRRVKEGKMKHEFHPEKMKPYARELYNIVSKGKVTEASEITKEEKMAKKAGKTEYTASIEELKSLLDNFKDFKIIKDFISLVGSTVKREPGHIPGDIDLHIRLSEPPSYIKRAIEVRLWKMLPKEIADKIHFIWGDPEGSHDTFVPLYDLALVRSPNPQVVKMQDTTTSQMPELQPTKWFVGKKVKYNGKMGKIAKIEPGLVVININGKEIETHIGQLEEVFECKLNEPFQFMYPSRAKNLKEIGRMPNSQEPYFVEEFIKGTRMSIHKHDDNLKCFGFKLTDEMKKELLNVCPFDYVVDAIFDGKYLILVDVLYYKDKSCADLKLYERKKILDTFNCKNTVRIIPYIICKDEKELKKAIEFCMKRGGAVVKDSQSTYIQGVSHFWKLFLPKKLSAELSEVKLFKPYLPMKPFGSAYYNIEDAVNKLKDGKEYSFEFKYNGFHAVAHKKGSEVKIYSEQMKDLSVAFPTLRDNIKKLAPDHDFIIDGELVPYSKEGKALGRDPLMKFIGAVKSGKKVDDSNIKMHIFDITYFDKSVIDLPLRERQKILDKLKFNNRVERVIYKLGTKKDAKKLIEWATNLPGSEGCVIKDLDSPYVFDEKSRGWIKFRHLVDIHALVLEKVSKKRDLFNYLIGIYVSPKEAKVLHSKYLTKFKGKDVLVLGHTFNTKEEVPEGSIIDVALEDVWRHTYPKIKKIRYSIHKPRFRQRRPDLKKTSTIQDLEDIVTSIGEEVIEDVESAEKVYTQILKEPKGGEVETRKEVSEKFWKENWWRSFPKSGKGIFIYHHHYRGLTKEESEMSEEELLNTNNSVHGDLRCQVNDKYLWGFSVAPTEPVILQDENGNVFVTQIGNIVSEYYFRKYNNKVRLNGLKVFDGKKFVSVKYIARHKSIKTLNIVTQNSSIVVTPNHSLFNKKGQVVLASNLREGDEILVADLPKLPQKYCFNRDLAWVFGYFVADGYCAKIGNKYYWEIGDSNLTKLEKARDILLSMGFETKIVKYPSNSNMYRLRPKGTAIGLYSLFSSCYEYSFSASKKRTKIVPKFILNADNEAKKAFLQGYFAGDGYKHYNQMNVICNDKPLLQGILLIQYSINENMKFKLYVNPNHKSTKPNYSVNFGYRFNKFNRHKIQKIIEENKDRWVYDVETESNRFVAGVGGIVAHNTVFTGSTKDLKKAGGCKLCKIHGKQKMQGTFKLYEPIEWAYVGLKKPLVTAPGRIGATKNYYAKFFAIDHGTYECGVWREHSFEIFLHGKKLKGRYIIQYAPVGGRRIWLISKPDDQRPYAETHDLKEVIKELRRKKQKYLVWAKPGMKPILINVEKYEKD